VRDQLASVTPYGGDAKQIASHGTGQNDLAAVGSEEVVENLLGVGIIGSGEGANYVTRASERTELAERSSKGTLSETQYYAFDPFWVRSTGDDRSGCSSGSNERDLSVWIPLRHR
jgi:hypothetical protein